MAFICGSQFQSKAIFRLLWPSHRVGIQPITILPHVRWVKPSGTQRMTVHPWDNSSQYYMEYNWWGSASWFNKSWSTFLSKCVRFYTLVLTCVSEAGHCSLFGKFFLSPFRFKMLPSKQLSQLSKWQNVGLVSYQNGWKSHTLCILPFSQTHLPLVVHLDTSP